MAQQNAKKEDDPLAADFRKFLWYIWRFLGLPDPTAIQYDIARYLQHGPRRLIIQAFRGVGKSWVTAVFVLWLLYRDPQTRILVVSANEDRALQFATFCKRLINEVPILQHLKARPDQRDSNLAFDVGPAAANQAPSVKCAGIYGQITGSRAHVIIPDDIEVPKNSATQTQREKLSEAVKEFDAIILPKGRILYLGTPQTEASVYNALETRGYDIRVWPILYPDASEFSGDGLWERYKARLAPMILKAMDKAKEAGRNIIGRTTEPTRFTDEDIAERRTSYGGAGFQLQFMLNTTLSDADRYPLRTSDLMVLGVGADQGPSMVAWGRGADLEVGDLPNFGFAGDRFYRPQKVADLWVPWTGTVMAIDPAGRGADELGWAIVKLLNGTMFLVAGGGLKDGYAEENLIYLAQEAKAWGVNEIVVEKNFGDGMFTQLLKPVLAAAEHRCAVEEVHSSGQKEKRIVDTLEPILKAHRLVVTPDFILRDFETSKEDPQKSAFFQLTRITRDKGALKHEDRLEAIQIAVKHWVDHMSRDREKAAEASRERSIMERLKQRLKRAVGPGLSGGKTTTLGGRGMRGRR